MKRPLFSLLLFVSMLCGLRAQVTYNANQTVVPYNGRFRPGINTGYYPGWDNQSLANVSAGNASVNQRGIGARSNRTGLYENILDIFGLDLLDGDYAHMTTLGMGEHVAILGGPSAWHQDQTQYCPGYPSSLFSNLYTPTWDGGANGTPYNDDNYWAAYVYRTVTHYKDQIRFWEIWNEPGLDLTFNLGWRDQNYPGNWWAEGPKPCENVLRAPIYNYIRTLRIAYDVIKTVDPDAYVCLGSVGYQSFMNALLSNTDNPNNGDVSPEYPLGGGAYFDCISFHSYPHFDGSTTNYGIGFFERHSDQAADGLNIYRGYYQQILDQYGYNGQTYPHKEWIVTEINSPRASYSNLFFSGVDQQINHMLKAMMIAKIYRFHQLHTYQLVDEKYDAEATFEFHTMGLYKKLGGNGAYNITVNDEGKALKTWTDLVYNTTYDAQQTAALNLPSNVRGYAWKRPNGTYIYALWAKTTDDLSEASYATYSFPASIGAAFMVKHRWDYGYTDAIEVVSSQNLALDARPIFLAAIPPAGGDCRIEATVSNFQCLDNGTADIAADDKFTCDLKVTIAGGAGYWMAQNGAQSFVGAANTTVKVGPFSVSNGSFSLKVRDLSNNCFTKVWIPSTGYCSPGAYCKPQSQAPWNEWISRVQANGLDKTSDKSQYSDFTTSTAILERGQTSSANITVSYSWVSAPEHVRVWIDFNQNTSFEDPGEKVFEGIIPALPAGNISQTIAAAITVPNSAPFGKTRMRVAVSRNAFSNPCESIGFGEIEDYSVNIVPSSQQTAERGEFAPTELAGFTMAPNPTSHSTLITMGDCAGKPLRIRVLSGLGQLLQDIDLGAEAPAAYSLDVSDLPAGTYVVELVGADAAPQARLLLIE
jgi:hypothetical protein